MILTIKQGEIRGNRLYTAWTRKKYYSFLGIPYAKPPIGDLRFKPPVKAEKWRGVFKAFKEGGQCYQTTFEKTSVQGTEDCLYLNVFIPEKPNKDNLRAVMVYVHGGGFSSCSGSPSTSSPDHLMDHDVILVTFNYRLHVLGFLNLGLEECSGNMGLKDQLMVFHWVKDNIEHFGGDSNNITLFGPSAGASSIHLHMMSPLSEGLFHKCILQSGTALSTWSFIDNPEEQAFELGRILDYNGCNDKRKLLEFLKQTSIHDLTIANESLRSKLAKRYPGKCSTYPFLPSVEKISQGAILLDTPKKLFKNTRQLPVIIGMNDKEGGNMFVKERRILDILINQFEDMIKMNLENPHVDKEVIDNIKNFYFTNGTTPSDNMDAVADLYTDLYFKHFYRLEEHLVEGSQPVYTYQFCYDGSVNLFKFFFKNLVGHLKGAIHADDHFYLFGSNMFFKNPQFQFTCDDITVTKTLCELWTNFAKTGNPNSANTSVIWQPTTPSNRCYLRIDKTLQMNQGRINERRYQFWDDIEKRIPANSHQDIYEK